MQQTTAVMACLSNHHTSRLHTALCFFGVHGPTHCRWVPEESANWLSQLFFIYVNSLVRLGSQKHLEQADLWDTAKRDEPERLWASFEHNLRATATSAAPQVRLAGHHLPVAAAVGCPASHSRARNSAKRQLCSTGEAPASRGGCSDMSCPMVGNAKAITLVRRLQACIDHAQTVHSRTGASSHMVDRDREICRGDSLGLAHYPILTVLVQVVAAHSSEAIESTACACGIDKEGNTNGTSISRQSLHSILHSAVLQCCAPLTHVLCVAGCDVEGSLQGTRPRVCHHWWHQAGA